MPTLMEDIDRLTERERERLLSIATVRGYRIQWGYDATLGMGSAGRRFFVVHRDSHAAIGAPHKTKRSARRALLQLMLTRYKRTAA